MDLSAPYTAVVPSLDGAVLEVLAHAGKPVTGRQVQRLSRRGSVPGIAAVLDRLVESGIVSADRVGASILYQANRDHLAWPAVEILVGLRSSLIGHLGRTVDTWSSRPRRAILFGSGARGDGDTRSDIDILLVHADDRPPAEDDVDSLRESVLRWTGNHAQVLVVSDSAWRRMADAADPLVDSVRTDGVDLLVGAAAPASAAEKKAMRASAALVGKARELLA